jgi:hypothetical protein
MQAKRPHATQRKAKCGARRAGGCAHEGVLDASELVSLHLERRFLVQRGGRERRGVLVLQVLDFLR